MSYLINKVSLNVNSLWNFGVKRNGSAEPPVKQLKGEPTKRLLRASKMGLKMTDIMFHAGPAKLTVSDAWTLIHPEVAKRNKNFNSAIPAFEPGWLVDKVLVFLLTSNFVDRGIALMLLCGHTYKVLPLKTTFSLFLFS